MQPLISTIIPVYNASRFLDRCIKSVIKQTFNNWQLILVNDGSTDNSLQICKKYAEYDKRIIVLNQENKGPGIARNNGLALAQGKYIVFVDSDDYISEDYFMRLSSHEEDVVFIDVLAVDESGKILRKEFMSKYKSLSKDAFLRSQMTGRINWGGCRKAARRELIDKNNISYSNHLNGEEALFSFNLLYHAKNISYIDSPVYHYVQISNSLSHLKLDDPWGNVVSVLKQQTCDKGVYSIYANTINSFYITAAAVSSDRLAQNYDWQSFKQKYSKLVHQLKNNIDSSYSIDKRSMSFKAKTMGFILLHGNAKIAWIISKMKSLF